MSRELQVRNGPPNSGVDAILIDPKGNETQLNPRTDSTGTSDLKLSPPATGWSVGLYRVVAASAPGSSVSAVFVASDGRPHLTEAETLPSPFSAFNLQGIGLPPDTPTDLTVYLAGQIGSRTYHLTTDDIGTLTLYIWPEQFGLSFFSAGPYRVLAPALGLEADFVVREHPVSAFITVEGPVLPGAEARVHFASYAPARSLWVVYTGLDGIPKGEALVGPTDAVGNAVASLVFDGVPPGAALLATPYDWGEASFSIESPTDTPTSTPTPTDTPTVTPTVVPCFAGLRLAHRTLRVGKKQTATVTTIPGTSVRITAHFPNRTHVSAYGVADTGGAFAWTYRQRPGVITVGSSTVTVTATAICANQPPAKTSRTYRINQH
jgi:hypothetical protein